MNDNAIIAFTDRLHHEGKQKADFQNRPFRFCNWSNSQPQVGKLPSNTPAPGAITCLEPIDASAA